MNYSHVDISQGDVVSFSAGGQSPAASKMRVVNSSGGSKLRRLLELSQRLRTLMSSTPIVINAYPAFIGMYSDAINVDTYLRQAAFSSALSLAAERQMFAIVVGMPLTLAELMRVHLEVGRPVPSKLSILSGGYRCPGSLERYLTAMLTACGSQVAWFHLYGVAEINSALLVAELRTMSGEPIYYPLDDVWHPHVVDSRLHFKSVTSGIDIQTDEMAVDFAGGLLVRNSSARLLPMIASEHESWSIEFWDRRTGAMGFLEDRLVSQLRVGIPPAFDDEIEFFDFARRFGFSWLEKPNWGSGVNSLEIKGC